jgi:hypothetical protein
MDRDGAGGAAQLDEVPEVGALIVLVAELELVVLEGLAACREGEVPRYARGILVQDQTPGLKRLDDLEPQATDLGLREVGQARGAADLQTMLLAVCSR